MALRSKDEDEMENFHEIIGIVIMLSEQMYLDREINDMKRIISNFRHEASMMEMDIQEMESRSKVSKEDLEWLEGRVIELRKINERLFDELKHHRSAVHDGEEKI